MYINLSIICIKCKMHTTVWKRETVAPPLGEWLIEAIMRTLKCLWHIVHTLVDDPERPAKQTPLTTSSLCVVSLGWFIVAGVVLCGAWAIMSHDDFVFRYMHPQQLGQTTPRIYWHTYSIIVSNVHIGEILSFKEFIRQCLSRRLQHYCKLLDYWY